MSTVARGKVAKVLSDREVAINVGEKNGVEVGDVVNISDVVDVEDPDTGESLGSLLLTKVRVEVRLVMDKMSVANVIDRAMTGDVLGMKPLKRLTEEPFEEDWQTVHVGIGDVAVVSRKGPPDPPSDDDIPF